MRQMFDASQIMKVKDVDSLIGELTSAKPVTVSEAQAKELLNYDIIKFHGKFYYKVTDNAVFFEQRFMQFDTIPNVSGKKAIFANITFDDVDETGTFTVETANLVLTGA